MKVNILRHIISQNLRGIFWYFFLRLQWICIFFFEYKWPNLSMKNFNFKIIFSSSLWYFGVQLLFLTWEYLHRLKNMHFECTFFQIGKGFPLRRFSKFGNCQLLSMVSLCILIFWTNFFPTDFSVLKTGLYLKYKCCRTFSAFQGKKFTVCAW